MEWIIYIGIAVIWMAVVGGIKFGLYAIRVSYYKRKSGV